MKLNTEPNLASPDDFYEQLIELHRGLSEAASAQVNAKLILLLANHIGDAGVLAEAMAAARAGGEEPARDGRGATHDRGEGGAPHADPAGRRPR